jgi:NTE family protein
MGALVGGLYAAGKLDDYVEWVSTLTQRDVFRLMDPSPFGAGAIRLERVLTRMSAILDGAQIEDLAIPFTAVATDLGARREVWFQSGPMDVAIRASIAMPGVITPIMVNGRLLVDGGVLNPIPIEPVMGLDADYTLGIALNGFEPRTFESSPTRQSSESRPAAEWIDRFLKGAAGIFEAEWVSAVLARFGGHKDARDDEATELDESTAEADPAETSAKGSTANGPAAKALAAKEAATPVVHPAPAFEPLPAGLGIPQVTSMAIDTMSGLITRFKLASQPPDVLVTVPGNAARTMDFHRAEELIDLGYRLTTEALDAAEPDDESGGTPRTQ